MTQKITVDLGHIQRTLLLPLWGRAVETNKPNPRLIDRLAVEIVEKIDYDFAELLKDLQGISLYGWIRRSLIIDHAIKEFQVKHPQGTIVNIGCGLDTTFERVDNGFILWYDLDLPDTISLRRKLIPETRRRQFIESSFLDDNWLQTLLIENGILFIAAGVLYYIEEDQVKSFVKKLAGSFPGSEFIFDVTSPAGVRMANKTVIKKSGMDQQSFLKWGIRHSNRIREWDSRIEILQVTPFFKKAKKGLDFQTYIATFVSDLFRMQYMIHIRFKS